jgi:transaldolase
MAFKDHGKAHVTIEDRLEDAERLFVELKGVGVDIQRVTEQLEEEGVRLFSDSFILLLKEIAAKRDSILSE